jgi:peptidylprolyl isomerase
MFQSAHECLSCGFEFTRNNAVIVLKRDLPSRVPQEKGLRMAQAKTGDLVRIHYTGTLTDGTQFDSSEGRDPLEFTVGSGQIIPGLDQEVQGMAVGEKATVTIPAEQAYGPHDPQSIQQVPRDAIPAEVNIQPGAQLQAQTQSGQTVQLTVVEVDEDSVTVDGNHPLAGRDLVFAVELVEIVKAA